MVMEVELVKLVEVLAVVVMVEVPPVPEAMVEVAPEAAP